ncbi:MAG: hypothetical protein ABDH49_06745 [Candidatus Hydrothermales bacterium]
MKKFFCFLLIYGLLFSKSKFKFGVNTSLLYENGKAYPVIGITTSYTPYRFLTIEGNGEYVIKENQSDFAFPLTLNLVYPKKYFTPYIGSGLCYNHYRSSAFSSSSLGYRFKGGVKFLDKRGASMYFESSYDVPDLFKGKGRWYFTGKIDKDFELEF